MQYKYTKEQLNYSDFASGKVFYSLPGHPAFPVRLASEIFQHSLANRKAIYNTSNPCVLYDPCCGAAYHLSVLAYLHRKDIREIIASDIDEKAFALAKRNLNLLDVAGLDKRIEEISAMLEQYGKESHKEALKSAYSLKEKLTAKQSVKTKAFQANALNPQELLNNIKPGSVDIIFTDVPYGLHSQWQNSELTSSLNPITAMLDSLLGILSTSSIVAIVSDKQQKVSHERYQRIKQLQTGKRRA